MKTVLAIVFLVLATSGANAVEIDNCRVLARVDHVQKVLWQGTSWAMEFDVQILEVQGMDSTSPEWCQDQVDHRTDSSGITTVYTSQSNEVPEFYWDEIQWYVWGFLDAGELKAEDFHPERPN